MAFKIVSQTVSEVEDRDPNLYVKRAEDFLKSHQYTAAIQEMDTAIKYAPHNKKNSYIFEKIKIYEAVGQDPTCVDFIKKHISALYFYLSLTDFYRVLALLQRNLNLYSNELTKILSANHIPSVLVETYHSNNYSRDYFLNRAQEFREQKQYTYALECISVVDDKYGENIDTCVGRAKIFQAQGLLREAVSNYARAANLSGTPVEVYIEIVKLKLQLRQDSEAKNWIEAGLKKFPNHSGLLHEKADLLYKAKNFEECLSTIELIIDQNSADAKAIYLKGLIYDHQGKFLKANWFLKKANRIDDSYHLPNNQSRERFLFRIKLLIILVLLLMVLLIGGQFIIFKTGIVKPLMQDTEIGLSNETIFVGQTVEVHKYFSYFPNYAKEPDVRLEVADPKLVKLDSDGQLTGLKEGNSSIKLVWENKVLASEKIQIVTPKVSKFEVELSSIQLEVGESTEMTTQLKMDYDKAESPKITFSSSNPSVAEVDQNGEVKAVGLGEATISANAGGISKSKVVYVNAKLDDIILEQDEIPLFVGQTYILKPTVVTTPSNEQVALNYSSSDETIAIVSSTGEIKALKNGEATITVSSGEIEKTVKVIIKPNKVTNLHAEYNDNLQSIQLSWNYDNQPIEDLSFEVVMTEGGETQNSMSTTERTMDITNISRGSKYSFKVVAVIGGVESEPVTVSLSLPESGVVTQNEDSRYSEEAPLNAKRVATMNNLVGYWKRTDPVKDNAQHDDRYLFIYGSDTYWRMDFQTEYGGSGTEHDTYLNQIIFSGNQVQADNIIFIIQSNTSITLKYKKRDNYGMVLDENGYVTQHYTRVNKSQVDQKYIDRYPFTQLP